MKITVEASRAIGILRCAGLVPQDARDPALKEKILSLEGMGPKLLSSLQDWLDHQLAEEPDLGAGD